MIDSTKVISSYEDKIRISGNSIHTVLDVAGPVTNYLYDYYSSYYIHKYARFKKTDIVLDFGCGLGRLSERYAKSVSSLVGIDISNKLIEFAKKNSTHKNISYYVGDSLGQIEERFDLIYVFGVFLHLTDEMLSDLIASFHKVLKDGGRIVFIEPLLNNRIEKEEVVLYRTIEEMEIFFVRNDFSVVNQIRVLRSPSYSFNLLKILKVKSKWILPFYRKVEELTLNRKQEHADFFWQLFEFEKNQG